MYLSLLAISIEGARSRVLFGHALLGPMGIWWGATYLGLITLSFFTWVYCLKRTWEFTKPNSPMRIAGTAYLVGAIPLLYQLSPEIVTSALILEGIWLPIK